MAVIQAPPGSRRDGVYAGQAAAALRRLHRAGTGPLIFWARRPRATLAPPAEAALHQAPPAIARWLGAGR